MHSPRFTSWSFGIFPVHRLKQKFPDLAPPEHDDGHGVGLLDARHLDNGGEGLVDVVGELLKFGLAIHLGRRTARRDSCHARKGDGNENNAQF